MLSNGRGLKGNVDELLFFAQALPQTAYTETAVTEVPVRQIDWSNNQERPNWTESDIYI